MKHLKAAGRRLALYLDDLLLLAGSACFVRAAWAAARPRCSWPAGAWWPTPWSSPGRGEGEDDDP